MVGPEAVIGSAVAKGVGATASEVLGEEPSIKISVAERAKDSPGLQKAAALRGQRAAVRQAVILQLWRPLARLVGVSREYFEDGGQFAADMASKLESVPDDKLIAPRANVAIPAMQGLGYSLDEPTLKEMYLRLLAEASNNDTCDLAHPSFAQIIRELQPEEASLLEMVFTSSRRHAIVRLENRAEGLSSFSVARNHVMPFVNRSTGLPVEERNARVWIDNWTRLGLTSTDYTTFFSSPSAYDWVEERPEMADARRHCPEGHKVEFTPGVLDVTDFGQRFADVVFGDE